MRIRQIILENYRQFRGKKITLLARQAPDKYVLYHLADIFGK